jgi:hypothetical protein
MNRRLLGGRASVNRTLVTAYLNFIVVVAALSALLMLAVKGRYLPRWIMDILDRLSDKTSQSCVSIR